MSTPPPFESPWPLYRISLDQYEAMVEAGVFTKRDRLHLINGLLVTKATQGDDHCVADELCRVALSGVVPTGWFIRSGKPVRLPPDCEPEPDQAVVRGAIRDYRHGHPGPADIAQIVEIAENSPIEDRTMMRVYGGAGIPVYWIVNLVDRQVEVDSVPQPDGYATRQDFESGDYVTVVLDATIVGQIAVNDILP
jgi:Uma2 family endonuclease